jgi:hypothetical protein
MLIYEDAIESSIAIEGYDMVHMALSQVLYEKSERKKTEKVFCFIIQREGKVNPLITKSIELTRPVKRYRASETRHSLQTFLAPPNKVCRHTCSYLSINALNLKEARKTLRHTII